MILAKQLCRVVLQRQKQILPCIGSLHNTQPHQKFSSLDQVLKAQERVVKALEREGKFEAEQYEPDPLIKEFLDENKFILKDNERSLSIELHKNSIDFQIQIVFETRAPLTGAQFDGDDDVENKRAMKQEFYNKHNQTENDEAEEKKKKVEDFCDFTVYVINLEGKCVAYDCTTTESKIQVNSLAVVEDIKKHKESTKLERLESRYNGPEFNTLDIQLQGAMIEFLSSIGVTEEVAAFIEHLSLDKEQRLYMRWLSVVKNFLS